ncbi:MAG: TRAP transporter substrate-binding protein [Rhodospirillales bacterium]|nr:TRAP transporter substrate-binding protein [Rhodospirillales bacterium]
MYKTTRSVILIVATLLFGMGTATAADFNMKFGSYAPAGDVMDQAAQDFAKRLVDLTKGRAMVNVFRNSTLGSNREVIEMAKVGSVDFLISGSTHVSSFVPDLTALTFPYMFKDQKTMFDLLDGPIGKRLGELANRNGLEVLGWWASGVRHVTNNRQPIVNPEDIKGLKLRTLPSPVHIAFFKKLGVIPTPMGWKGVMPALQQGVIDGQENPPAVVYPYRVYEFQKYYSLTGHANEPIMFVMSKKILDGLPADVQSAIREAAAAATKFERGIADDYNKDMLNKLRSVMKVNDVPQKTRAHFQSVAQSVYKDSYDKLSKDGRAIVDAIIAANK